MVQIQSRRRRPTLRIGRWHIASLLAFLGLLHYLVISSAGNESLPLLVSPQSSTALPSSGKKNPLLVLHVGPPKTGTTSLQHMLHQYEPQLLEDNYFYAGNSSVIDNFKNCIRRVQKAGKDTECWSDFVKTLEVHRKQGHNIILSNEVISVHAQDGNFDLIRSFMEPWMPNVLVVVGYRHLHNFMPSTHFELQKNQRWPSIMERGKLVTPFTTFWMENHKLDKLGPIPMPATAIAQFRAAYYNVSVLDIEMKEQITEFFCGILPDATHTCRYHQGRPPLVHALNTNDQGQVNYDALAILAFQRDYLKKDQTRPYLRARIKTFNEKTLHSGPNDFVLDCLTPDQEEEFLQESLQHARAAGFSSRDDAIRADFAKAKAKKKYCTINATAVFEQQTWLDFFSRAKTKW